MASVPILSAVAIGAGIGVVILAGALIAVVRVLSWLEVDEGDAIPDD